MRTVSVANMKSKVSRSSQLRKPRPKPIPVPKVEVAAPKVEVAAPEVNIDLGEISKNNAEVLSAITETLKAQKPATKPTEWEFNFHRDDRGFVQRITAKAT